MYAASPTAAHAVIGAPDAEVNAAISAPVGAVVASFANDIAAGHPFGPVVRPHAVNPRSASVPLAVMRT
jgi:hypothetical protein